jgi:hypothetical protein
LQDRVTREEKPLKDGTYIPVDYDSVGGTSNAVGQEWILRALYEPEEIYGSWM